MTRTVDGKCPQGHAYLLMGTGRLYCPHRDHEGRSVTHPLGFLPRTPAFDSGQPVTTGAPPAVAIPRVGPARRSVPPAERRASAPTGAPRAVSGRPALGSPVGADLGLFPAVRGNDAG